MGRRRRSVIEAFLLTGGRSARMGRDKASLPIGGEAQAARIVRLLREIDVRATILGKEAIDGAGFLADDDSVRSPLDALRRVRPTAEFALVLSCDLPRFDPALVAALAARIGDADAAVPFVDGFRQPMVALYRRRAFDLLPDEGCPTDWLAPLNVRIVDEAELRSSGLDPATTRGANTPDELRALVEDAG